MSLHALAPDTVFDHAQHRSAPLSPQKALDRISAPVGSSKTPPRALVIVAHPDDESLALGARLERLHCSLIVHVTDGTPRDGVDAVAHGFTSLSHYRDARRNELRAALALSGIPERNTLEFGIPDQAASFHLVEIARRIEMQIDALAPEFILTHPYEGGHPDHDACAFAVHTALRYSQAPLLPIVEAPFYHAGPQGIETGCFLRSTTNQPSISCHLTQAEQMRKQAVLRCFTTQRAVLGQFGTAVEQFRIAPAYDFAQPPHPGTLFYENFPWGMTGESFRGRAQQALAELESETVRCR